MARGYNRSSRNGIFRRRSEVYWRRRNRPGLLPTATAVDIVIDLDVVDITIVPVTPTRQKVIDVPVVDITTEIVAITFARATVPPPVNITTQSVPITDNAKIIDVTPIDVTVELVAVADNAKIIDVTPIDVTVELVGPDLGTIADVSPVDVTVQPVTSTVVFRPIARPPVVDITVQPVAPDLAQIIDIDPVDITVESVEASNGVGVDVPPVDITVELLGPTVGDDVPIQDVTVEVVEVRAGRVFHIEPVDISIDVHFLTTVQQVKPIPPVDVTVVPTPIKFGRGYDIPAPVDITTQLPLTDNAKIIDVPVVNITTQTVAPDNAKIIDVPVVNITVSSVKASAQSFKSRPTEITVQPVTPKLGKIIDVPVINITAQPVVVDPAKIVDVPVVNITVTPTVTSAYTSNMDPVNITVQVMPVEVVYGADKSRAYLEVRQAPKASPVRVYAQNILSGEWLHDDLPITGLEIEYVLSGPQQITGSFPTEIRDLFDAGLEPWATWIHVEENNEIRASGILQPTTVDKGQALSLRAVGVSAYPDGIPYLGPDYSRVDTDVADVVRDIWSHVQAYPDGNLAVVVRGTTGYHIGKAEPAETVEFVTGAGENVSFESGGPYKLVWWEAPDCGSEIGKLASEAPFDYVERQRWHDPVKKDYVQHFIDIGWPRAGRKRPELVFAQDENLKEAVGPGETDGTYASQVVLLGKGEGSSKIRGYAGQSIGTRLRRVKIIDDKTVDNIIRANSMSREEITRRQALYDITDMVVKAYHDNAHVGSYDVGDDVAVTADVPWLGRVNQWERITSYRYQPGGGEDVYITCRRSESFEYGRTYAI